MFQVLEKYIPKYSWIYLSAILVINMITYFGSRVITSHMQHYSMELFLDTKIPLIPGFISIYILSYVCWIVGYIMIARESRESCAWILTGEMIAKLICLFIFLVYPTTIIRPHVMGSNVWSVLTAYVYNMDPPDNLFPSIHCMESWFCFRGSMYLKKTSKSYSVIMFVCAILIFLSTLFTKQHVIIDVFGGIIVAELGLWLSSILNAEAAAKIKNKMK